MKKIVVIGATSTIAHECVKLWIKESPKHIFLVARDLSKALRIGDDLKTRSPDSCIKVYESNFKNPQEIEKVIELIYMSGDIDLVLIAQGSLPDQSECQNNLNLCNATLEINGISPVLFAECFAKKMERAGQGIIALIGSVAGDRGRKSNYVYGAAKGMVDLYAQGMQHRFANTPIKIIIIKPGPTDTPMTSSLKDIGIKLANVKDVAVEIVEGINKQKNVIYAPNKWRVIMLIIKNMPSFIFNKLNI